MSWANIVVNTRNTDWRSYHKHGISARESNLLNDNNYKNENDNDDKDDDDDVVADDDHDHDGDAAVAAAAADDDNGHDDYDDDDDDECVFDILYIKTYYIITIFHAKAWDKSTLPYY